jgi:hypothetical protein
VGEAHAVVGLGAIVGDRQHHTATSAR